MINAKLMKITARNIMSMLSEIVLPLYFFGHGILLSVQENKTLPSEFFFIV